MKLIISTIVGFLVLFLLGLLLHGMLFKGYFAIEYENVLRPAAAFRIWSVVIATFLQALLISLIYSRFFNKGGSPFGQGFTCGLWLGLYSSVPFIFYMYANMQINNWQAIVLDGMIIGFMAVIASIAIALVYGQKKDQASTT